MHVFGGNRLQFRLFQPYAGSTEPAFFLLKIVGQVANLRRIAKPPGRGAHDARRGGMASRRRLATCPTRLSWLSTHP
jgi:hypothetical protein